MYGVYVVQMKAYISPLLLPLANFVQIQVKSSSQLWLDIHPLLETPN